MGDEQPWSALKSNLFSFFSRYPKSSRMLIEHLQLGPGDVTLDIGCGPGDAVRAAGRHAGRAVGVDPAPAMVAIARKRGEGDGVEFQVGGAEALPLPDETFTAVWTIRSYHHWNDRDAGLRECHRVLRDDGHLYIVENSGRGAHALSQAKIDDTVARLEQVGFSDVDPGHLGRYVLIDATR